MCGIAEEDVSTWDAQAAQGWCEGQEAKRERGRSQWDTGEGQKGQKPTNQPQRRQITDPDDMCGTKKHS